jgi:putative tricarboxylic transport membrane protein
MLLMGLVGFTMLRLDIPVAPFLIAFVLGPLLEDNFRQALLIGDGDNMVFFRNPICILFWCLTALSVFVLIKARIRAARTGKASILTTGG